MGTKGHLVKEKRRAQKIGGWSRHVNGPDHQPANRRLRRRQHRDLRKRIESESEVE